MSLQCLTKFAILIVFFQYCLERDVDPLVVKLIRPQPHIRSAVRDEMDTDECNWELSLLLEESSSDEANGEDLVPVESKVSQVCSKIGQYLLHTCCVVDGFTLGRPQFTNSQKLIYICTFFHWYQLWDLLYEILGFYYKVYYLLQKLDCFVHV